MKKAAVLILIALLIGVGVYIAKWKPAPPPQATIDAEGWYLSLDAARNEKDPGLRARPILLVAVGGVWGGYERGTYGEEPIKGLTEKYRRARMTVSDTALAGLGMEDAPAMAVFDPDGRLITRLVGPRDFGMIRYTLERCLEFPAPAEILQAKGDPASHLRYTELLLERDSFALARDESARYLKGDSSPETAHGWYLHAYAQAELAGRSDRDGHAADATRERAEARKAAAGYLRMSPTGRHREASLWILIVLDLQEKREKEALKSLNALIASDSGSPYTRQAVLAYSIEYLARGKGKLLEADKFLTSVIEKGSLWKGDLQMARATLRMNIPSMQTQGLADLEAAAQTKGEIAQAAQERLIMLTGASRSPLMLPNTILFFQNLARDTVQGESARLRLARLYIMQGDMVRAREEAGNVAAGRGEYADDALLLLGSLELEGDKNPQEAVKKYDALITGFGDRETVWPARYGRARALFFSGDVERALTAFEELHGYFRRSRIFPDAFSVVVPHGASARQIEGEIAEYVAKLKILKEEPKGPDAFRLFMDAVLTSAKGESNAAEPKLVSFARDYPSSSLADDALMEMVKLHLMRREPDSAVVYLDRIIQSYNGSDQFENAGKLKERISQAMLAAPR